MTSLILQQMDYVFFVGGLSFILLGGVCFYLSRNHPSSTAWEWLGAFGMLQGVHQWLDLTAMSLSDNDFCQWLRFVVVAASFLCLCEFGRQATLNIRWLADYRWPYAVLLAAASIGRIWGSDGLDATTHYVLGLVGGGWGAFALWKAARTSPSQGRLSLKGCAACIAAFAAGIGLFVAPASFFPASIINQASFLRVVGIPVQAFIAASGLGAAGCLWHYMIVCRRVETETLGARRPSRYVHLLAAGMVVVILAGWVATNAAGRHATHDFQRYYIAHSRGAVGMHTLIQSWQIELAQNRLIVIGATCFAVFLLAGSLLSVQNVYDNNSRLLASEQLYRSILDNSPNCLQLLDHQGRCLAVNSAGLQRLGLTKEDVLGKRFVDIWPSEARPAVEAALLEAYQGQRSDFEAIYVRRDGQRIVWQVVLSPVPAVEDHAQRVVCMAVDVTDQRRAEAELRRAKEVAEAATQAKTEFLANMSHEIRTPITAVLGYTDLLLEPQLSEEERWHHLCTIRRNGELLLDLINDILDISKIEVGKIEVERIPCHPWQILSDVASLMQARAESKDIALSFECDGPIPEIILTDPTRLRQILVNLVGNAVKFTKEGRVRVIARLQEANGESQLRFDVIDTGIGISSEQLSRIFHPFTQADSSTNRKYGGTGLGLTISKQLAYMLGGDIHVESELGKGTKFSVTVATGPLDGIKLSMQPPIVPTHTVAAQPMLDCRVLLAEDGADNQRLVSLILKKAGAEVSVAQNGREAIEMALAAMAGWNRRYNDPAFPFDIILMDIQMPEIDGCEATRILRQRGYVRPIIALSAHATTTAIQECLNAGCDDYLSKPIDRDALLQKVAEYAAINKQRLAQEKNGESTPAKAANHSHSA